MSGYSSGRNTKMAENSLKGFFTVLFQPEKEKQKTAEAVENTAFPAVLSLVRMAIQNFSKNPVISMVSGLAG